MQFRTFPYNPDFEAVAEPTNTFKRMLTFCSSNVKEEKGDKPSIHFKILGLDIISSNRLDGV